jgi:hypothetical protein
VTEQDHASSIRLIVTLEEVAAENRRRPQQTEQVPGHARAKVALRFAGAVGNGQGPARNTRDRRERGRRCFPIAQVKQRHAGFVTFFQLLSAEDENPIGVVVRVRLQHHAVDDAEDGGVEPDAEAKTDDRHSGKRLAVPKAAHRVADIF